MCLVNTLRHEDIYVFIDPLDVEPYLPPGQWAVRLSTTRPGYLTLITRSSKIRDVNGELELLGMQVGIGFGQSTVRLKVDYYAGEDLLSDETLLIIVELLRYKYAEHQLGNSIVKEVHMATPTVPKVGVKASTRAKYKKKSPVNTTTSRRDDYQRGDSPCNVPIQHPVAIVDDSSSAVATTSVCEYVDEGAPSGASSIASSTYGQLCMDSEDVDNFLSDSEFESFMGLEDDSMFAVF